jgi:hypothetical protein
VRFIRAHHRGAAATAGEPSKPQLGARPGQRYLGDLRPWSNGILAAQIGLEASDARMSA